MKTKMILGLFMMLIVCGFATAIGGVTGGQVNKNVSTGVHILPISDKLPIYEDIQKQNGSIIKNSTTLGLNRALIVVTNENARLHIEANLAKMQEKHKNLIQNMSEIKMTEFNNKTFMEGKDNSTKFLGLFKANKRVSFVLNDDGTITRIKQPLDFLYKYNNELKKIETA